MFELVRDYWPLLRDLYDSDRTNLAGYDLINCFIYAKNVQIYTTDDNWLEHGNYVLIHSSDNKTDVYLNTLNGNVIDLQNLLCDLQLNKRHWLCGYRHLLKDTVKQYCLARHLNLNKLDYLETFVYHLPASEIEALDCRSIADISFGPLQVEHASLVDEHWPYQSNDSLALIQSRIRHNISVGAFDRDGNLLAWCLRSIHGSLSNLHVLQSHRRLGLASLLVRLMAVEIAASGSEVLATIAFGNEISQKFFKKLGFRPVDKLYYTMVPQSL